MNLKFPTDAIFEFFYPLGYFYPLENFFRMKKGNL
jgi:hypothetical protein